MGLEFDGKSSACSQVNELTRPKPQLGQKPDGTRVTNISLDPLELSSILEFVVVSSSSWEHAPDGGVGGCSADVDVFPFSEDGGAKES